MTATSCYLEDKDFLIGCCDPDNPSYMCVVNEFWYDADGDDRRGTTEHRDTHIVVADTLLSMYEQLAYYRNKAPENPRHSGWDIVMSPIFLVQSASAPSQADLDNTDTHREYQRKQEIVRQRAEQLAREKEEKAASALLAKERAEFERLQKKFAPEAIKL